MVKHQTAITFLILLAGEKTVVGNVKRRKPLFAEVIAAGALGCQDQDYIVVGCIHAVEVSKVQVGVGVEEHISPDLKALAAIWGVLWRLACVELRIAAEENALQLATDW